MIRVPGSASQGKETKSIVEAIDLFPTLVTVAGQAAVAPSYLDGMTLAPLIADPTATVKPAAFSEFVKCYSCCKVPDPSGTPPWPLGNQEPDGRCEPADASGPGRHRCPAYPALPADPADVSEMETCFQVPRETIDFIGYSMRTAEYRYTEWLHFDGKILHGDFTRRVARELYSHTADPGNDPDVSENENIAEKADTDPALLDKLHAMLQAGFKPPAAS
jgi:arylsulfatase A-like enzyme